MLRSFASIFATLITNSVIAGLYYTSLLLLPFSKRFVNSILKQCDIEINGNNSWDPIVKDNKFYAHCISGAFVGLGEAYTEKHFECNDLREFFLRLCNHRYYRYFCYHPAMSWWSFIRRHFNTQNAEQAYEDAGKGYDEGVFTRDEEKETFRTYSCGYWRTAVTQDEAFEAKLDLIARKLKLKPGMKILDAGCGEGTLCKHLAQNYDVTVVGLNISKEMTDWAQRNCRGLNVTIERKDCRIIDGHYDRITCIQMMELLGYENVRPFFESVHRSLANDGIFIIECLAINHPFVPLTVKLFEKYFDTKTWLPYYMDLMKCIEGLFVIEDFQNIGYHYGRTFLEEIRIMDADKEALVSKVGDTCFRATKATYAYFSAELANRHYQVYHLVLSKNGLPNGYEPEI